MPKTINLSNSKIGESNNPFIIAEIGSNFGNYQQSIKLVDIAHAAGAAAVKFQTFKAKNITAPNGLFTLEDGSNISQYEYFKRYELSEELHRQIKTYCDSKQIIFFSTPSHEEDVELLQRLDVELFKLGSDDLTNIPFIKHVAQTGKPIILSTGMSTLAAVEEAIEAALSTGNQNIVILHCVVGYPAKESEANINVIKTLQHSFDVHVGFSDHFRSHTPAILAAQLGASVFEKHITLDRGIGGPDNDVSVEPNEFREYVKQIRLVDQILGIPQKRIAKGEQKWLDAGRKSITAIRQIAAGEPFSPNNIRILRPSGGIEPRYLDMILMKRAKREINCYEAIKWEDVD